MEGGRASLNFGMPDARKPHRPVCRLRVNLRRSPGVLPKSGAGGEADEIRTITDVGLSSGRRGVPLVRLDRRHALRQELLRQRERPLRLKRQRHRFAVRAVERQHLS